MEMRLLRGKLMLSTRTTVARAYRVGGATITPQAHAALVQLPFATFVRIRPTAVLVQREDQTDRIPIRNITRLLQLGIAGLGVSLTLAVRHYIHIRKEQQS